MKLKTIMLLTLVLLTVSFLYSAPLSITKICDEATILAFTGGTDVDPEAITLRPDGTFVFFQYNILPPTGASSYLIFNPTSSSVSYLAGPAEMLPAVQVYEPTLTSIYSMQGLVSDNSGNAYTVVVFMPGYKEYILKITPAGVVSVVIPSAQGSEGASDLTIDKATNTLYTYVDDFSNTIPYPSPLGIHAFSASLTGGTLSASTLIISQADLANACNPALGSPTALNIYGLAYRPLTNDLIAADSTTGSDSDDFLKITLGGTPAASLFCDNTVIEAVIVEIDNVDIAILDDGALLCTTTNDTHEGVLKIDSTGATVTLEADEAAIIAITGGTDFNTDYGRAITTDGVNLYFANAGAGGEGIVELYYAPPAAVSDSVWEIY